MVKAKVALWISVSTMHSEWKKTWNIFLKTNSRAFRKRFFYDGFPLSGILAFLDAQFAASGPYYRMGDSGIRRMPPDL